MSWAKLAAKPISPEVAEQQRQEAAHQAALTQQNGFYQAARGLKDKVEKAIAEKWGSSISSNYINDEQFTVTGKYAQDVIELAYTL